MSLGVQIALAVIVIGGEAFFVWSLCKSHQLDLMMRLYFGVPMLVSVAVFGYCIHKTYVKESIEDGCWAYLRGEVYCPSCNVRHRIASICAEQVWDRGTSDQGWRAYVFAEQFKDGSYHDSFGFELTLQNRHVVRMKYDPNIHPITGE